MSMQVSKMITNRSKEKIASHENTELLKRPGTATLERPSILDPSYLRKLDMSLISREKLMNIKNLLAKPHRHEDRSNGSSYDSILSDTSMNISDESIDSKFFIGSDDDSGKRNKKTGEKYNKNNKKKNQKTSKSKSSTKGNNDKSGDKEGNETNIEEYGDGLIWGEEDYRANEKTINRTYRVKNNRRQSIIGNTIEPPKEETSVTSSSPSPKCSLQKIDSPSISTPHEHKRDKKCKKSDETIYKSQPKLIVKKNVPMNKYSKKSVENLSLKKSKSKERINVKPADKSKKVVSNGVNKDKTLKENVKDIVDPKETTNVSKTLSTENKKEKVDKMKYETVPRQKKNSEPSPLKQRATNPSHRRSISEVTKIELESKENTTPKRTFLRKNSRESNSPIVVRKFMDPITGKLRTVDEIPSSVKKIKETTLKVPNKADKQKTSRKACSSSENSPRKSSSGETLSNKLTSNCDNSSHKSFDCAPSRKSSVSETHKQCRKASLNTDITPRKVDKTESGSERRRSYFGQSGDTIFSTQIIAGEKYEDLFKKSNIIPRDDPVNPMSSELIRDETHSTERFNTNVEHNTPNGCDDQSVKSQNMALPPHNDFFSNGMELLNMSEFRSLIVTPTFYTDDESWNSKLEGNSTGSLKKHKTIECNFCLKQFGTASFSFHEPHCRQIISGDIPCSRCNNKVPSPLVDIHEEHCRKIHAPSTPITLSPSHISSSPAHLSSSSSPTMSPSRKPRTVICYLCGREFGKSSIGIHEPQCLKKWHIENEKLPPNLRRPEPTRPEVIRLAGTDKIDTEAMGEAAFKSYVAQLVPCGKCGRKFFPDRVVVHENVCKGVETRK